MASTASSSIPQLSIKQLGDLSVAHHNVLMQAITNTFSTELADITMAQLVDGIILVDVLREARGHRAYPDHPMSSHNKICKGAVDKYLSMKAEFNVESLMFDQHLIHAFLETTPGARSFSLRLIELVSRAIHLVAVQIFNMDEKCHPQSEIDMMTTTEMEQPVLTSYVGGAENSWQAQFPPFKTLFYHICYQDSHQYPHGVADIAGFWAEDRIFGGIFLFDRGETGVEANDVFMHHGRSLWTVRIWRLLDSQLDAVMRFLTRDPESNADTIPCPFPLYGDEKNTYRFDDYDAMAWHNIYRDRWERDLPAEKNWSTIRRNTFDYPEALADFQAFGIAVDGDQDAEHNTDSQHHGEKRVERRISEDSFVNARMAKIKNKSSPALSTTE